MTTTLKFGKKYTVYLLFFLILLLASSIFVLSTSVSAAPTNLDTAKTEACKVMIKKTECEAAVKACPTQKCITDKAATFKKVTKVCRDESNPQACNTVIVQDCNKKTNTAEKNKCIQEAQSNAVQLLAAANGAGSNDEVSLSASGSKGKYQCGNMINADDNVKTQFNFGCAGPKAPKGTNPIVDVAYAIIKFLSVGVGLVLVASVIYAGIQYSSSGGSPEATAAAKKRIQSTIIGLVFYLLIFAIIQYLVPGGLFNG